MESHDTDTAFEQSNGNMENGHAGDGNGVVPAVDSMEFRILMAYAKRRRPSDKRLQHQDSIAEPTPTPLPAEAQDDSQDTTVEKKKKRKFRLKLPSCLRPKTKDPDSFSGLRSGGGPQPASLDPPEGDPETLLDEELAGRLAQISTNVDFLSGDLETDCHEDMVQELAKMIRDSGDQLNEKIKDNKALHEQLKNSFSYGLFSRVIRAFLDKINLVNLENQEETEIAMTCEVVSRLTTMDTLPVMKTMHFGARYMKDYFSPWVKQNGGWEKVFNADDDDDDDDKEVE